MIPPTHLAPPASAAVDQFPPMVGGSNNSAVAIARALNQPVRVVQIDEEEGRALLVEPLHFHRVVRRRGLDVVCKSHVTGDTHV